MSYFFLNFIFDVMGYCCHMRHGRNPTPSNEDIPAWEVNQSTAFLM